jgi:superfamily I DNA/RNA helicase
VTVQAFTGGAGCGKTFQLMQSLSAQLDAVPLAEGQKVLALTFMHGSRRRLEERLGHLPTLRGRADCTTIDSFAWRLVRRWQALAAKLGHANIDPNQYERVCDAASELLQVQEVRGWVAASFPFLVVDEAQDLTVNRLRLIQSLATRLQVFAAADEFQCLDEQLRPNPACTWLSQVCPSEELTQPRRTNVAELLAAAAAIRGGVPPTSGTLFKVQLTPRPPLAGSWISSNLCWYGAEKSVAVITPALGQFAKSALDWTANNKTSRGAGPYAISWEESETKAAIAFSAHLALQAMNDIPAVTRLLSAAGNPRVARDVTDWMELQRRARSKIAFSRDEILNAIALVFAQRRRTAKGDSHGWRGMTVHGAKNREFDNVIVLWPAAVTGSDDQKRRLLYNAVTRARSRCLVLVQAKASLSRAPFG